MTKAEAAPVRRLTLSDIEQADDLPEEDIEVPEWGGPIRIKALTKRQQRDIRRASMRDGELDDDLLQQGMLAEGVIDPALTLEQAAILMGKNAGVVDRIIVRIGQLSGVRRNTEGVDTAVEEAAARFRVGRR